MHTPNSFTELVQAGSLLATIDGSAYHEVRVVLETADGDTRLYCMADGWAATPAARIAVRDAEITLLRESIAQLQTALLDTQKSLHVAQDAAVRMCPLCDQSVADAKALATHLILHHTPTPLEPWPIAPPAEPATGLACPVCAQEIAGPQGLPTHLRKAHQLNADLSPYIPPHARPTNPQNAPTTACPICGQICMVRNGLATHLRTIHRLAADLSPLATEIDGGEWRCAECESDAFAASIHRPSVCIRCAPKLNGVAA